MQKTTALEEKTKELPERPKAKKTKLVAPDGGWGWMVLIGYGLGSLFMIPIIQNFGLIYKDRLKDLEFSSTDITTLISVHSWFGMILGIFNAPLLKKYGYRKMSAVGVAMFTLGTLLTAFANSFVQFVIFYGMIASMGSTYGMSSFSLAMNTYFKEKRSFASSRVTTIMGLGPIFMPLLISEMLGWYGIRGTVVILAAINMHGFIGACLLQPVKWHLKEVPDEEGALEDVEEEDLVDVQSIFGAESVVMDRSRPTSRRPSVISGRHPPYYRSVSGEKFPTGSNLFLRNLSSQDFLPKPKNVLNNNGSIPPRKDVDSVSLMDNEDYNEMLGASTLGILEKSDPSKSSRRGPPLASMESLDGVKHREKDKNGSIMETNRLPKEKETTATEEEKKEKRPWWRRFGRYLVKMYDLDLLADPVYWNLTVGMSVAIIGELTFSLLTPFILNDMGLSTDQIAIFSSVIAVADLIFRFLAPYFGQWCNYGSRRMYLMALFMLLLTRLGLFLTNNFTELIAVAVALGIGKGFRTVYWVLVIPDHVPLEKLASASAFQNLSTGIFLIFTGPLLGLIVQINNKYSNMIYASNVMTATTILLWMMEFCIVWCMDRRRQRKEKQKALTESWE